ncbi:MAG: OmpH family outer membrane protein [Planctomycetes bacterium]|nr:OmpH family outer membrane protein [Planctomycetota bacterium]
MKAKTMFLGCLVGVVILAMGYPDGGNRDSPTQLSSAKAGAAAESKTNEPALNIGVVSIRRAMRNCKATVKYRERAIAENDKTDIEEERLSKEIQAFAAGLKALKLGSSDYLARYRELLQKQGELKALQEFNSRRRVLRDLQWTQDLYKEILQITKELAEQKGLDLVLERDEIDVFSLSINEISETIRTHKVLYSGGCVDLTNEVVTRLDKIQSKFGN